jgi:hypothetical protein
MNTGAGRLVTAKNLMQMSSDVITIATVIINSSFSGISTKASEGTYQQLAQKVCKCVVAL